MKGIDFTYCELRDREVINMADGRKLGRIIDLALHCSGRIIGIIVPGEKRFARFFSGADNIFIPWINIKRIGDDVILVELVCQTQSSGERENDDFPIRQD